MKRIFALLLAVSLLITTWIPAFAATQEPVPAAVGASGPTVVSTRLGGNPAVSQSKVYVGEDVVVIFDKGAVNWSDTRETNYQRGTALLDSWVKFSTNEAGVFAYKSLVIDGASGKIYVYLTALKPYNGVLSVYLNGDSNVNNPTPVSTQTVTKQVQLSPKPTTASAVKTRTGGTAPTRTTGSGAITLKTGESISFKVPSNNFEWDNEVGKKDLSSVRSTDWVQIGGATKQDFSVRMDSPSGDNAIVTLTALKPGVFPNLQIYLQGGGGAATTTSAAIKVETQPKEEPAAVTTGTKSGGTAPKLVSGNGTLKVGDTLRFQVAADNFNWSTNGQKDLSSVKDTSWIQLSGANKQDFSVQYAAPSGNNVIVTLTALRAGNFPKLQMFMQSSGGAKGASSSETKVEVQSQNTSVTGKITGIASSAQLGGTGSGALLNGRAISSSELDSLTVQYGDELLLPLTAGFFTWEGTAPPSAASVTSSQLRNGNIKLATSNRKGSSAFHSDKPELVYKSGQSYVQVKFAENGTTLKDIDFSIILYLTVNGSRHQDSELLLAGTLEQDMQEVDSDSDYADISNGEVIESTEYVRKIELYLGSGVSVHTSLAANKKYSGTAKYEVSGSDSKIMDYYPSIETVLVIKHNGLNRSGAKVTFDMDDNYYVYDADGKYVGRSSQQLPFSNKYYLSSKKIDLDTNGSLNNTGTPGNADRVPVDGGSDDVPPPSDLSQGGGVGGNLGTGSGTLPNRNENPRTGR